MESYFSFRPARRRPRSDLQLMEVLPHPVYLLVRALVSAAPGSAPELSYVDVGPGATIHALVRCGGITGSLVVTLDGRPVENFLRVVGERGTITGDFVRGTIHSAFGPGSSRFGKMFAPFHTSSQLALGTAAALTRRVLQRQTSYPGLAETIAKFYSAVAASDDGPIPPSESLATVNICTMIGDNVHGARPQALPPAASAAPVILVTGGTGFLGHALVSELVERGHTVRCVSRSGPAPWKTLPGVDYQTADLSRSLPDHLLSGIRTIVHAAAATEGGWDAHQAHSIDATRNVLVAAARAGIRDVVLVSSLGVLATPLGDVAIDERTPLDPSQRETLGPYTWGKLTSERLAWDLAEAHELRLRVVRPGAIIDHQRFEPPGRLGRQVESLFVAVGHPGDRLGVIDLKTAARAIAWIALHPADAPDSVNLLALELPTKDELVTRLRSSRPGLRVCWLPEWVVALMAWAKPSLRAVFASRRYDDRVSRRLIADAGALQVATVIADRSRRAVSRSYSASSLSPMELQE